MGMSCFFVEKWMRIIKVSCFSVHVCPQRSLSPCFVCICLHIQYEVTFACTFTGFSDCRLMGMSCFFVENCTRIANISCFSVHFCFQLSPISCFVCFFVLHIAYFVHLCVCVILCLCAAVCGRQFLSRVDMLMQFYDVF